MSLFSELDTWTVLIEPGDLINFAVSFKILSFMRFYWFGILIWKGYSYADTLSFSDQTLGDTINDGVLDPFQIAQARQPHCKDPYKLFGPICMELANPGV